MFQFIRYSLKLIPAAILILIAFSPVQSQDATEIEEKLNQGRFLFELGKLPEAITLLEEVYTHLPNSQSTRRLLLTAYKYLGIEYYGQARCEDAIALWSKALDIDPGNKKIEGFIEKCRTEMRNIAEILGEPIEYPEEAPGPDSISEVAIVPAAPDRQITQPPRIIVDTFIIERYDRRFSTGLGFGAAYRLGGADTRQSSGWLLKGHADFLHKKSAVGTRLEGLYARLKHNREPDRECLSVFGGGISALTGLDISPSYVMKLQLGLGLYEVLLTEFNQIQSTETMESTTDFGVSAGIGLERDFGRFNATIDARYLYLSSALSPDLLLISIGLATK